MDPYLFTLKLQDEPLHFSQERIDDFVVQTLLGTRDLEIEQHLQFCSQCQARMEEAWDFIAMLRQAIVEQATGVNPSLDTFYDHKFSIN